MNMNAGRVGRWECISLVLIGCSASALFALNTETVFENGNSTYLSAPLSALLSVLVFLAANAAIRHCGLKSLRELMNFGLGKVVGFIASAVLTLALIWAAALPLGRMLVIMGRYIFVESKIVEVAVWLIPCLVLPLFMGFETIARAGKLFLAAIILSFLLSVLIASPAFESYRLYPLVGDGAMSMLRHGLEGMERFLPALVALLILLESAQGAKGTGLTGAIGALSGGVIAGGVLLALGLLYPAEELKKMHAPMFRLTTSVQTGSAYLRLDKVLLFLFLIASILTALYYCFAAALLYCRASGVRDIRPPAVAFMMTIAALAIVSQGNFPIYESAGAFLTKWLWAFLLVPVLAAALGAAIRCGGKRA